MPIFTPISPEKAKEFQARLKGNLFYTPEQNLAGILTSRYKRGIKTRKFHYIALINEDKIYLFDYLRRPFGVQPKTNKGLGQLHSLAVRMFTDAGKRRELRDGGFMFDLYIGLKRIDLTMDVDLETLEEQK